MARYIKYNRATLNLRAPPGAAKNMILVTGSAGFIGANFVLDWLAQHGEAVIGLDKLTYAGNLENLASLKDDPRHIFVHGDIGDAELVAKLLAQYRPRAVINFAAESHVDRSIHGPEDFIQTNIVGTFHLLEAVRAYWQNLPSPAGGGGGGGGGGVLKKLPPIGRG